MMRVLKLIALTIIILQCNPVLCLAKELTIFGKVSYRDVNGEVIDQKFGHDNPITLEIDPKTVTLDDLNDEVAQKTNMNSNSFILAVGTTRLSNLSKAQFQKVMEEHDILGIWSKSQK